MTLYLVKDERLAPVVRNVRGDAELIDVVRILARGPNADEQALGLASPLGPGQVRTVELSRGTATVDLRSSFADLRPAEQIAALAQLVFTLTARPGVGNVVFMLEGESIEVPRGDGALTTDALAREDYTELAPRA